MPNHADQELDKFVRENGYDYEIGRAFYEFVSKEDIPEGREVILMNKVCCSYTYNYYVSCYTCITI